MIRDAWKEYQEFRSVMRAARSWAKRTKQSFAKFIANAIQAKLDYEQSPHCSYCDSAQLEYREGYYPTGVVAPDGGEERWYSVYVRCLNCGAREDIRDYEGRLKGNA